MGNGQGKPVDLNGEVNLNHFRLMRVVGRGAFGKVRIVERKDTGLSFALKYIRKDEVVRSESVRNIIRERRMLEHVNHPFICNLRYSFQDIEYMYLVVDLMSGGDLRFHISRKTFTEEAVRFWISELACALKYVHAQGIIHRDVKPDNVLLDADGHVHLTDFNVASDIIPGKVLTSKSGTLAYLAPEVYGGRGYDIRADWWSLGVLFYECIYNKRPFEGNSETSLTNVILHANAKFPITQPAVSTDCVRAIRKALEPNPDVRLGHTWEAFTKDPFFAMIDFAMLEAKQIEPVFVPSADKTNFDATYDLEELLLEEAPLEARARRQKPRERLKDDATEKEIHEEELYRSIERDFHSFDYTVAAYKKITGAQGDGANQVASMGQPSSLPQAVTTNDTRAAPSQANGNYQSSADPRARSHSQGGRLLRNQTGAQPQLSQHMPPSYKGIQQSGMVQSPSGGVSFTLEGTGSWSDLARRDNTLPTDANAMGDDRAGGSGGVFGFLRGKKRGYSPKPKERGVLGKEGARQIVG
ncbi:putative AGC YANK protein kinase [Rosellinia necatrix]|uniref:Putative AGC YANK protein kinase n=1 Tax=Rosellinia necatrix TaxID=77044 RepID=A0A1W2TFG4_ROSNE|nr:putative AGC YANK protein kinase [Rosellinia necatrix]